MSYKNGVDPKSDKIQRTEWDSLGAYVLPRHARWGVHTARAVDNFPTTGTAIGKFPDLIKALVLVKQAAALANHQLGYLSPEKAVMIEKACQEISQNLPVYLSDFKVDVLQGGAGTSTNMNANEVVANVGLLASGLQAGQYDNLHPNDDVNMSQSTNDVYPTAVKISVCFALRSFLPSLKNLVNAFEEKAEEFKTVLKIGRTQLQDAVPMTLGQEFKAYAGTLRKEIAAVESMVPQLSEINLGGTAIGTGINCDPRYGALVTAHLSELCGFPLKQAENLIEATSDVGAFVTCSSVLKRLSIKISKIANDLRLLSSGPRAGLAEIVLPAAQAGSSIMPGKINPVIPEMVNQVAFMVIGHDATVSFCAEGSQLQLNAFEPAMGYCILDSIQTMNNSFRVLAEKCVRGIRANKERCLEQVQNSIGIITAFVPVLGYELCASIAKQALAENRLVADVLKERVPMSAELLADLMKPEAMIVPLRKQTSNLVTDQPYAASSSPLC
ncbi:MAG: aspartate ammonia-lyase [Acetobacter persici]|uniref:aspartate ammonia-lyase n=1 Tax=Acetobacter persici TaxID=1076596 RepID=UPI0039E81E90